MTPIFEMVKYHSKEYPSEIPIYCEEIAAHLDINNIELSLSSYSLHTEYSYGKRKFSSCFYSNQSELSLSQKGSVPQLWKSEKWAEEFAEFIFKITDGNVPPTIIEIHPPFNDYTDSFESFVTRYKIFENLIISRFPNTQILIENRCGAVYHGGKFILSKVNDFLSLSKIIERDNLHLRFAFDIPQLYTAHSCSNKVQNKYIDLLKSLAPIKHNIAGVHLWGKRKSATGRKVAHCGDLYSYFENNNEVRNRFLNEFSSFFSDGQKRKLVLEVNSSNEDLISIISDLVGVGIRFE